MTHHNTVTPRARLGLSALALLFAGTPVLAQTDTRNPDEIVRLDEFKVSGGFATSLALAAIAKQSSPTITEVLVAEDLGKLPDVSIADSLTRITGLTTQRVNGRSQNISIRGLVGDFSTGMLNGREQVSTGLNRAVEFDQYPAELLDKVYVYKTAQASLTGQGLSGTVDLRTVSPLAKGRRLIAVNGYYEWTQYDQLTPGADGKGNRLNLSYVDQFANKTVGIAIGFAHTNTPWQGKQFQAWGYPTDASGNYALGGTKSYVRSSNLERDALVGVIEYKPNDWFHSTIDVYVSSFEETQLLRGMEAPLAVWGVPLPASYTTSGGLVTKVVLSNIQPVVRNDIVKRHDSPFAIGWNVKLAEKEAWPVVLDAAYSRVTRTDVNLESYSGLGFRNTATPNADTMTVELVPGGIPRITPTHNYASGSMLRLTDPQGWGATTLPGGGMHGYLKYIQARDELGQLKASTQHKLSAPFRSIEFGASFSERYKRDGETPSGFLYPMAGTNTLPLPPQVGTTDIGFLGLGKIYAYDPLAAFASGIWGFQPYTGGDLVANRFKITEKITQFYGQLNFDTKLGGVGLTGDVGVRAINADQQSTGYSATGSVLNAVSGGDKYTDWAPNLNLNFKVGENSVVRASVARQLVRPRMHDMRASRTWSFASSLAGSTDLSASPWSGRGGNPNLRPWRANSIDLSIEHYFAGDRGYVALAGFQKKLLSFIYTQTQLGDFTGFPVQGTQPVLWQGPVSQPLNGQGGNIRGLEFTAQLPIELVTKNAVLKGFGLVLNGAYTDSSVKPWGPAGGNAPIAGLARKVANATVYYERAGFSFRVSTRYHSETRQYITTFGAPNRSGDVSPGSGFTMAQPETIVDGQVSYAISRGALRGVTLYFQGYNLNNEPLVTYNNDDPRRVMNYQTYGASYALGASYKF